MGYFRAPYWGNLIIRSSFSHLFIKRFSIPTWMPCIVLAAYSISVRCILFFVLQDWYPPPLPPSFKNFMKISIFRFYMTIETKTKLVNIYSQK
jgi:hypothetical protein